MKTITPRNDDRRPFQPAPAARAGTRRAGWFLAALGLLAGTGIAGTPPPENPGAETIAGYPAAEAMRLGEQLYREGLLPSGEYLQAVIQDDLPVDGRAFHCMSCHQRSGLGSSDGNLFKLPITGPLLFKPYPKEQALLRSKREDIPEVFRTWDLRPAYTHETLARAIREGITPAGVTLNVVMPRYQLGDRDMAILIHYLSNLNREFSPGVDDRTIRFATVITEEVPAADRQAMLTTLEGYIADRSSLSRNDEVRADRGSFEMEQMQASYRRLILDRWELKGPPATWRAQLEERYRRTPVFALLGGISTRDWRPIHEFCEENQIPCIFPITDFPVISDKDRYTLYLSRGLYQEGETAAYYLTDRPEAAVPARVVQVRRNGSREIRLSEGFQDAWRKSERETPETVVLPDGQAADGGFWQEFSRSRPNAVVVAWLGAGDLAGLSALAEAPDRPRLVLASSSLQGNDLGAVPARIRAFTLLTYPFNLPQDKKRIQLVVRNWLKLKNIPYDRPVIQSDMYFLGWMLSMALMEMRSWFYRDYFMEGIDMSRDQDYTIGAYPRVTFGFGQRYASKGCYVVQLTDAPKPELVRKSEWVIH
jgi:hypothetical protein